MKSVNKCWVTALTLLMSLMADAARGQYATAKYDHAFGDLYLYETSGIGTIGFLTAGLFDYSNGLPMIGTSPAQKATSDTFQFFNSQGLRPGLFHLGDVLPSGLSPADIAFGYIPVGMAEVFGSVEDFVAEPAASAKYNGITGEVSVDVATSAQGLLLNTAGLFNTAASPMLGLLAPSQFDSGNLMFFNNDAPLPAGTFNLGAVLPPGLSASQISLATKGNGIAVGIPVTVVPEPAAATLALMAGVAGLAWVSAGRRQAR